MGDSWMVARASDKVNDDFIQWYSVARRKGTRIQGAFRFRIILPGFRLGSIWGTCLRGAEEGFGVILSIVKLAIQRGFPDRFD